MPEIIVNMAAVRHNALVMRALGAKKGFSLLPVVKMVASFPPVLELLREHGYSVAGVADIDELAWLPEQSGTWDGGRSGAEQPARQVLINLWPLNRVRDVVERFSRSPVSSVEGLRALEGTAASLGLFHSALLMLDLGDGREGAQMEELPELLRQMAGEKLQHVSLDGVGTTLGCLAGVQPDEKNMTLLREAARLMEHTLGKKNSLLSVGGSVCLDWLTRHPGFFELPQGHVLELRAGDPLFLGYDMYRNLPFPEGDFRRDTFNFRAAVLEVKHKRLEQAAAPVLTGHGTAAKKRNTGQHTRVLLDCGSLHTQVEDLTPDLPGANLVEFSANYAVLDMDAGAAPPALGDMADFRAGYWAVARAFRTPTVIKRCRA